MSDEPITSHPDISPKPSRVRRTARFLLLVVGILAIAWLATLKTTIGVNNDATPSPKGTPDPNYVMPDKEVNRLDVLILGVRGKDDPDAEDGGPLLTDSIELFSYDKETHAASLVSIPRDLQVLVHDDHLDKLNTVYEYGYYHSSNPLEFVKNKFSQITGVYVDKVVILNFSSFKEIIDSLGGVDVTLAQPFSESKQWGYPFALPAGVNHLDGQQALYYARSRYSSTDFDRAQRQQQIIFAVKDKVMALNFISDPVKTFSVFNTIRKNIATDIGVLDINQFLSLARSVNFSKMQKYVISTDNLVHDTRDANNSYILLPNGGSFDILKTKFKTILSK